MIPLFDLMRRCRSKSAEEPNATVIIHYEGCDDCTVVTSGDADTKMVRDAAALHPHVIVVAESDDSVTAIMPWRFVDIRPGVVGDAATTQTAN